METIFLGILLLINFIFLIFDYYITKQEIKTLNKQMIELNVRRKKTEELTNELIEEMKTK